MKTYRLRYNSRQEALLDLMEKGVIKEKISYDENDELDLRETPYTDIAEAVVYIGKIQKTPGTYDENGETLTEPTYVEGYHVDLLLYEPVPFTNEINPTTPNHQFAN